MNRRQLLGMTAATTAALAAPRAFAAPASSGGLPGKDYATAIAKVRAYAERHRADHSIPGMTIAMVDRDGFLAILPLGYANLDRREPVRADHLFQIGSITKCMAALCVMRLHAAGRIDPAAEVATLVPGAGVPAGITLAHLIEHSSGLPDDAPLFPRPTGGKLWQGYAPRAHWSYANTGYDLIGKALERATGKPFEAIVREQVFAPLGMATARGAIRAEDRARYAVGYRALVGDIGWGDGDPLDTAPWVDVTFAAGCVAATAADMACYVSWLIAAANGHGAPLLSDADARAFTTATIDAPAWASPGARYGHGLATVQIIDRPMLHHTGGMIAFSSSFHVDPAAGVACFASTNVGGTGYRPRDITAYACQLLRAAREGGVAPAPRPTRTPIAKPADYTGRFTTADGRAIEISPAGAGLSARFAGGSAAVDAAAPDQLFVRDGRLGRDLLVAERAGGTVAGFWHGADWYARAGTPPKPAAAAALALLAGRYDNDDPWRGTVRVVARASGLWMDGATPMTRLADGSWRLGEDEWSPERAWFDAPIDGRPQRLSLSGADFMRREDAA